MGFLTNSIIGRKQRARRGFTVVELIVVVVVIAILAAVTAVSYRHVRNEAYATKMGVAIDQAKDAFSLYFAANGNYPHVKSSKFTPGASYYQACIGEGYKVHPESSSTKPSCRWGTFNYVVDEEFNAALNTVSSPVVFDGSELPTVTEGNTDGTKDTTQGVLFQYTAKNVWNARYVDGVYTPFILTYTLPFDNGCLSTLRNAKPSSEGGNYYTLTRDPSAKESTYNDSDGKSTCVIDLETPQSMKNL